MPAWPVDGMDVIACEDAARARDGCRARRRRTAVPGVPHLPIPRPFDVRPELYRDKQEVEEWKKRDPILTYGAHLRELGLLDDDVLKGIEDEVAAEVDQSVEFAEAGTWEPVEDLTRFVYSDQPGNSDGTRT